jgi:L-rhamnose mutarotase
MQRYGTVVGVRPDRKAEYLALHANVWPQVEQMITSANIRNFTIFVHGDLLFGYYEYVGDDHAADLARIAADPDTQRWWALTDQCQESLPGTPPGSPWAPMSEAWHLD